MWAHREDDELRLTVDGQLQQADRGARLEGAVELDQGQAVAPGSGVVTTVRRCRVTVITADGVTHAVEVQGTTVFEVAAAGLAELRREGWAEPLAPAAVIRVEVQAAPIIQEVPIGALERWANGPSTSPKQELLKRALRRS